MMESDGVHDPHREVVCPFALPDFRARVLLSTEDPVEGFIGFLHGEVVCHINLQGTASTTIISQDVGFPSSLASSLFVEAQQVHEHGLERPHYHSETLRDVWGLEKAGGVAVYVQDSNGFRIRLLHKR